MASISGAQIVTKFAVAAAAGNTTVGTAATTLGDQISTTAWAGGAVNDIFDNISGADNAASVVDYRCIFLTHTNTANPLEVASVFLLSETAGGSSFAIASDNIAASAIGAATQQAAVVVNETTAPVGVSAFVSPTTLGTALALGNIPVGFCKAIWIRRTAANTVAVSNDGCVLQFGGDTGAL